MLDWIARQKMALLAMVVLLALLAVVWNTSVTKSSSTIVHPAVVGTIEVHGVLVQDQFIQSQLPVEDAALVPAAGIVSVTQSSGEVATVVVGKTGRFTLRLRDGTYQIEGMLLYPLFHPLRFPTCSSPGLVVAGTTTTASVTVICA
jgi:hypothetical protein